LINVASSSYKDDSAFDAAGVNSTKIQPEMTAYIAMFVEPDPRVTAFTMPPSNFGAAFDKAERKRIDIESRTDEFEIMRIVFMTGLLEGGREFDECGTAAYALGASLNKAAPLQMKDRRESIEPARTSIKAASRSSSSDFNALAPSWRCAIFGWGGRQAFELARGSLRLCR
jgi:hypothetical protein